jgi:hypothetical protein
MRLRKYEIRISVTKNLYDRISQEAKHRDTNMAFIAREKLIKHFIQHEKLANLPVTSNIQLDSPINKTIQSQLIQPEKKLFSAISKIEKRFKLVYEQIDLIVTMLDRFYFDSMKFLPDIPNELLSVAISIAHQRHNDWLKTIKKVLKNR